jgi:hypothetical protein
MRTRGEAPFQSRSTLTPLIIQIDHRAFPSPFKGEGRVRVRSHPAFDRPRRSKTPALARCKCPAAVCGSGRGRGAGVHGEIFKDIRPVNTVMQVTRFIDPEWLVEIEVDAIIDDLD